MNWEETSLSRTSVSGSELFCIIQTLFSGFVNEIKCKLRDGVREMIDNCYSPWLLLPLDEGIRLCAHTCQFSTGTFKRGKYVNPPFIKSYIKLNACSSSWKRKEERKDDNATCLIYIDAPARRFSLSNVYLVWTCRSGAAL